MGTASDDELGGERAEYASGKLRCAPGRDDGS